jgi:uncharacterized protein (UPF0332 family)
MIDVSAYFQKGLLKKQQPNFKQVAAQISRAIKDLATYKLVVGNDPEWAASIAYQAMLRAGRALLFSFGYLPANGQQHKTVVEITGLILGKEYETIVLLFEKFRRKRNLFFYDSIDTANATEAKKSAETAQKLIEAIQKQIKMLNPQIEFDI